VIWDAEDLLESRIQAVRELPWVIPALTIIEMTFGMICSATSGQSTAPWPKHGKSSGIQTKRGIHEKYKRQNHGAEQTSG
jgi:hypothetical protein